jgi:hypothetical protein
MKKTKRKDFVARILQSIRNIGRIARLIYNKRHKKAKKIVKNETIRTIKTTHDKLFWLLEYLIPAVFVGLIIITMLYIADMIGLGFSSESEINWFIGVFSFVIFIALYELVKCGIQYLIDKYIPKE